MSVVRVSSVFCDEPGCPHWIGEVADSWGGTKQARKEARAAGWTRRDGKDICPRHAAVGEVSFPPSDPPKDE